MSGQNKDHLQHALEGKHPCYVLVTCDEPNDEGFMQVQMSYSGDDPVLASYLLEGAQSYMLEQQEAEEDKEEEFFQNRFGMME